FSSVEGVGQIILAGEKEISLRVWINPIALAARDLTIADIETALQKENIEFPSGRLESKQIDLSLKLDKNYKTVEDFRNLTLKKSRDGSLIKLKDVARVEFGPLNLRTLFKGNGYPVVGIGVYQQSNANTIAVADGVKKKVIEIRKSLPEGVQLDVAFDRSNYIRVAVNEVYVTLFISIILVIGVIYLFLGNLTSVIIPTLAIPVSLVATFLLIYGANFTLNLFTLMALVIAIGLVVDDAIVMLENIYRRVETGETPLVASYRGASQVSFAIISTTVVLIAVFVPLIFIQGIVGKLFTELALTLSFSIIVSAFVALTLSPMLASKYLKITHTKPNFLKKFDNYLEKFSSFYFETLILLLLKKKQIFVFLIGILISVVILFKITPKELIPPEDRGVFFVIIQAPDGSGFEYTKKQSEDIEKIFTADLGKGLYRDVLLRVPGFQSGGDQVNSGFVIVLLENWSKRKKFSGQNLGEIFQKLSSFPGVKAFPIMPQGLRGGAGDKPVQFVIKGNSYEELIRWKEILKSEVTKNKNLVNVDDDLDLTRPQLKIKIDANKAADLGVNIDTIG
ncbi:MAG: efflux RND transporter permease subunit, partial [Proteobacteria bacterium]|nr:efflux RND transporter permease subunit [Pseudomonadota bacterium]